ncbi:MAG: 1-acyl-sn-glycerol-3-phosphate acyltransferase [Betaproteobacteria bacterium]|nr:1-acyl-sn-glycerol-3-phosphate acyltransferase [Pseudomonadota bacterium]NBO11946.1 1-acyl-sn-glycerol-3-phosphate acyltransferase [Betaproteobacteria bacterium]NBO44030.1 1-acyl-sn-glycerol-3-phosphate acyltransferase [Betaproteobacteria bacterium]NBP10007.1 1-acyl-sn-glycerol-3-phosphate acyltransferase [Betaproteobacteria bacterium]NBP61329.1 1-acyl-sn-glycerol-3-phosphate acyltransferase [Betaproteobacteria bacterium]
MAALRTILFGLVMLITVIPFSFLTLLWSPLPLPWRYRLTIAWPKAMIWLGRWLCGMRWQCKGWEKLPDGPAIIMPKHQSTWETFFLIAYMPRELVFVFKRELLWVPFFGWGLGLLKMIHIDRAKGADAFEQVVTQGTEKLAQGRWIIMFPEGTRTPPGEQGRYKSGAARLALRAGAPVVPIAVNSGECWPKRPWIIKPGLITVSVGDPIPSQGQTPESLTEAVRLWIEEEMLVISPHRYKASIKQITESGAELL